MSPSLPSVVVVYLAVVALAALAAAVGVPVATAARTGAVVAEVLLVANAVADLAQLMAGVAAPEPAVHLGYVAVSVVVVPLLLAQPLPERARSAVLCFACLMAVVVVVRQQATA